MTRMKYLAVTAVVAVAFVMGYITAIATPQEVDRIYRVHNAVTSELTKDPNAKGSYEPIEVDTETLLRRQLVISEREGHESVVLLGDAILLIDSLRKQLDVANERHKVAKKMAELLIQNHLSQPMLILEPDEPAAPVTPTPESEGNEPKLAAATEE